MLPYWTAPLAAALGNLLICAGVLWTTKPQKLHRVFALLTGTLFLWNLDVFCLYFFEAEADALWWSRLCRPGMFLAPAALYHFVATFRDRRGPLLTILVVLGYLSAALFIVADFQGEMIAGLRRLYSGYWPVMRPPYNGFIAVLLLSFLVFLASLVDEYQTTQSPRRRVQVARAAACAAATRSRPIPTCRRAAAAAGSSHRTARGDCGWCRWRACATSAATVPCAVWPASSRHRPTTMCPAAAGSDRARRTAPRAS